MKTIAKTNKENRVQQVVLKTLAVLISLVLLTYTINAQGMWKQVWENASLAMETYETGNSEFYAANNTSEDSDMKMNLEYWMTDAEHFTAFAEPEAEPEDVLGVETWMTDAAHFAANSYVETEAEEPLELENWMISENFIALKDSVENKKETKSTAGKETLAQNISVENKKGNIVVKAKNFTYRELKQPALKFERWMFDSNHFKVKNN